jgi:hypothetical protein
MIAIVEASTELWDDCGRLTVNSSPIPVREELPTIVELSRAAFAA